MSLSRAMDVKKHEKKRCIMSFSRLMVMNKHAETRYIMSFSRAMDVKKKTYKKDTLCLSLGLWM